MAFYARIGINCKYCLLRIRADLQFSHETQRTPLKNDPLLETTCDQHHMVDVMKSHCIQKDTIANIIAYFIYT